MVYQVCLFFGCFDLNLLYQYLSHGRNSAAGK